MVVQYLLPLTGGTGYLIPLRKNKQEIQVTGLSNKCEHIFFQTNILHLYLLIRRYTSSVNQKMS